MRVLLYGFGPYLHFRTNVTAEIVRGFSRRRGLKRIVFPVRFQKKPFIDAVKQHRPDVVLGLGQCSGGRLLRIECRAVNRRRDKTLQAKAIVPGGAPILSTDLKLHLGANGRRSWNAGNYVCNYSMYVILDWVRRHRLPIRYGFVHIPHRFRPDTAVRLLAGAIERIEIQRRGTLNRVLKR